MMTYFDRTASEQELICKAYNFEIEAIEKNSTKRNPYREALKAMGLWEAIEEAVEMAFK